MAASDVQMFTNLVNVCLGAGILSVPWGFAGSSLAGGLVITAVATAWCTATNVVLVYAAERAQKFNLGALLSLLPGGQILQPACNGVIAFGNFLCLVAYMVIVADCVQSLAGLDTDHSRQVAIAVASVFVFPLLFLDQSCLAFTSLLSILANWYIAALLIVTAVAWETPKRVCLAGVGIGDLTLFSVVVMAISTQASVLPMYNEMASRSPRRFAILQTFACFTAYCLIAGVAIAGNLAFGTSVASNVIMELPSGLSSRVAQIALLVVIVGMYPLIFYPVTAPIRQALHQKQACNEQQEALLPSSAETPSASGVGSSKVFVATCVVVNTLAALTACSGIQLGQINDYNGIVWLVWFTIIVPAYVWWNVLKQDGLSASTGLMCLHLGIGLCTGLSCLVLSKGNYVEDMLNRCAVWTM